jgi:predicted nuclease of predicted toxin-antitoxin system
MKFVADEGVDAPIVEMLRSMEHDVLYIAELDTGAGDEKILAFANLENRILLTRDKDFGELVFRLKKVHSGIVLERLYELETDSKVKIVQEVVDKYGEELYGSFTVIQPGKVRIRKLM